VKTDAANTVDGEHMAELIDEVKEAGHEINKVYGDSAYCDWEEIEKRENEEDMEFCVKTRNPVNKNGFFTKDHFKIDLKEGTVTCPVGQVKEFDKKKVKKRKKSTVGFPKKVCKNCPLRDKCTDSKNGRQITINAYEDKIQKQREYQKTAEFREDYSKRANGERTISHLTRHGGRQGRYVGTQKTDWQIIMASINHNIKKVMAYLVPPEKV